MPFLLLEARQGLVQKEKHWIHPGRGSGGLALSGDEPLGKGRVLCLSRGRVSCSTQTSLPIEGLMWWDPPGGMG